MVEELAIRICDRKKNIFNEEEIKIFVYSKQLVLVTALVSTGAFF
jgi:hypothetical protein